MDDIEYQAYLKKQTYDDLLSIRDSINRMARPERFALINTEIEVRDHIPVPPPLTGIRPDPMLRPYAQPAAITTLTKALVIGGFFIQVACALTKFADPDAFRAVHDSLAIGGGVLSAVGSAMFAKANGYSRWLGVLGFFGLIGIGYLFALPRKQPRHQ
jgi:hypothetical protein